MIGYDLCPKVLEGDLVEQLKSCRVTIKFNPKEEWGNVHFTIQYEKLHDEIIDPHALVQFMADLFKDLENHLVNAYSLSLILRFFFFFFFFYDELDP